jgi:chromosome segregation ATPase
MASSNEFITQFEESMKKLANIRRNVQSSIQSKEQFTSSLKSSLSEINNKLKDLADKISLLKKTADDLQKQVDTNSTNIGEKDAQMQAIQQQIAELTQQRDAAVANANKEKQDMTAKINEQQQTINEAENKLRGINDQLATITSERDSLRNELTGKGERENQHAAELKKMTDENEAKLTAKQEELKKQISECDAKIQNYEQQIQEKDAAITSAQQNTQGSIQQFNEQLAKVNQEKQELTNFNNELIEKIKSATGAISEAADDLVILFNVAPNAKTQTEVNGILKQVNESIQRISNALSGSGEQQSKIAPDTNINIAQNNGKTMNLSYGEILNRLKNKVDQGRNNPSVSPKYKLAYNEIRNATNSMEINDIIKKYSINFTADSIQGGRKTKKHGKQNKQTNKIRQTKQKGGFTYKTTFKRRSISLPKSSKHSFRRTSRRSSR